MSALGFRTKETDGRVTRLLQVWLVKIQTVDASSHHAANERRTSICTVPISSPVSPLTRGRDSDFSGIGGGCQVTGKLTIACCLLLTVRMETF